MVIKETVAFVKYFSLSNLSKVHCSSDDCLEQFKNFKNFLNLSYCEHDFDVPVCNLSLQQVMECHHVIALVVPLTDLQLELVFSD